jgi:glutamine amidotransferase
VRPRAVIVESGGANVASLAFALERLGCEARLSADAREIRAATHVLLPGVGAAADAMARLRARGLDEVLATLARPLLGICLGMQLLYQASEEGDAIGLGLLPGVARRFDDAPGLPVPHMGWNELVSTAPSPLMEGVPDGSYVYFVHSYALPPAPETRAVAEYGVPFSAVVQQGLVCGTQFHPERSGRVGARILANFLGLEA